MRVAGLPPLELSTYQIHIPWRSKALSRVVWGPLPAPPVIACAAPAGRRASATRIAASIERRGRAVVAVGLTSLSTLPPAPCCGHASREPATTLAVVRADPHHGRRPGLGARGGSGRPCLGAPRGGDRVSGGAGVEDRIVGKLDPVHDVDRIEDDDFSVLLRVRDERLQPQRAEHDALALLRPRGRRVLHRVALLAQGAAQLELGRPGGEALLHLRPQVAGIARHRLLVGDPPLTSGRLPAVAHPSPLAVSV